MYRGKIDEWRFIRSNTNLIHCSLIEKDNRVDILNAIPLPFDYEIREEEEQLDKEQEQKLMEDYKLLKESGALNG